MKVRKKVGMREDRKGESGAKENIVAGTQSREAKQQLGLVRYPVCYTQ